MTNPRVSYLKINHCTNPPLEFQEIKMWKVMENDVDDYTITLTISDTELKIDEDDSFELAMDYIRHIECRCEYGESPIGISKNEFDNHFKKLVRKINAISSL